MNIITVAGNVGQGGELKTTKGDPMLKFSVADSKKYKDKESCQWFNCTIWGKRAEGLEPYIKKGDAITVIGELEVREYEGKDGTKKTSLDVRVLEVKLQGGKKEARQPGDDSEEDEADEV